MSMFPDNVVKRLREEARKKHPDIPDEEFSERFKVALRKTEHVVRREIENTYLRERYGSEGCIWGRGD